MILNADIDEEGTLVTKLPSSLIPEAQEESNWENISNAIKKVDYLNLPGRSYDEIMTDLRNFRETGDF